MRKITPNKKGIYSVTEKALLDSENNVSRVFFARTKNGNLFTLKGDRKIVKYTNDSIPDCIDDLEPEVTGIAEAGQAINSLSDFYKYVYITMDYYE